MAEADSARPDSPIVRPGCVGDATAINAIYNHYVLHTVYTFDLSPWDEARRVRWIKENFAGSRHFFIVATRGKDITGFACNARFRPKAAYDSSTEVTVYTLPAKGNRGTGRMLYSALFARIADTDLHRAYAGIALPNAASIRLHENFGFRHVGTMAQVGTKFGRRIDVSWYQKDL